ncbi:MAG: dihydrodipicolinate synthase family protein [Alphaproteobacteria bacterium]|nr:dihydrodipicolinate synthase family protein [Alphaproteobacteria bacterium]
MTGLHGIVPILLTPFDEDGNIDFDDLSREIEATLDTGVHGIGVAIGSEIFKFGQHDRKQLLAAVVSNVAGRVPVVMNTSAPGTALAVSLARDAAEVGADRLMIWPPDFFPTNAEAVTQHLSAIAAASSLPIVLQDVPQAPIQPSLALAIADRVQLVDTIKVETQPTVDKVGQMQVAAGKRLSVLGGAGGGTLVEEHRRGARGTMPFASQASEFMAAWSCLEAGDEAGAEAIVERRILPVSRLGFQAGDLFYHIHKELLRRRGLFKTAYVAPPTYEPDAITRGEIDRLLTRLEGAQ